MTFGSLPACFRPHARMLAVASPIDPEKSLTTPEPKIGSPEQHDDHIWLTVDGGAWAIHSLDGDLAMLWRGYEPALEFTILDMTDVDWDSYTRSAVKLLETPPL
jgi:hypothetical protein